MKRVDHSGEVLDGRYRLIEKIGEGGMGSIYLCQHALIGRRVAVKLLRVELTSSKQMVERFYREARAAAAIKHKNIIDIFDLGLAPWGEPYLVMEYLKGESFGTLITRAGPLSLAAVCGVIEPTLKALEAAHQSGVIHRDLKPENIFLVHDNDEDPNVKLIDFGVSKFRHEEDQRRLTQTGSLLGTPDYLSPEQARGEKDVDGRADIWATGIIMYEALTFTRPFSGENYNELIHNIKSMTPVPPSEVAKACPAEADSIVMRALEKDPARRWASAAEMLGELETLECFEERKERLSQCTGSASEICFASGDLGGDTVTVPINVAAKVLEELARGPTPNDWSVVQAKQGKGLRRIVVAVLVVFVLVAIGIGGAAIFMSVTKPAVTTVPEKIEVEAPAPTESKSEPSRGVGITLEGLPPDAKVYYQDALVQMNPFRVEERATVAPLRVEAEGFETFNVMVLPDKDTTVQVSMSGKQTGSKREKSKTRGSGGGKESLRKQALEAAARLGGAAAGGAGVARAEQQLVYTKNKRYLKRCYDQALERGDASKEEVLSIDMKLVVNPSGSVTGVSLSGPGTTVPSLNECLKREASKWTFPPNAVNNPVEFSFAFTTKE